MTTLCILLVENDAVIASLLSEMLEGVGPRVCSVEATEAGAVSAAARHEPDLMIVDANLDAGTGAGAMEQITRARPVRCVLMSGYDSKMPVPSAVMLRKPFKEADLVCAIQLAMDAPG